MKKKIIHKRGKERKPEEQKWLGWIEQDTYLDGPGTLQTTCEYILVSCLVIIDSTEGTNALLRCDVTLKLVTVDLFTCISN